MKPSSRIIAKALPSNDGRSWHAQFAIPGRIPDLVSKMGKPEPYPDEEEARLAACEAVVSMLQNRPARTDKPERYKKLTPGELSTRLDGLEITATNFAYIYGTTEARVMQWLDGSMDVPHPARILLDIFAKNPEMFDIAERSTNLSTTRR